jgi:site-specific recombinase XerD
MIHRQNWLDTELYLDYLAHAKQLDPRSVEASRTCLRRLLVWADSTPFGQARSIEPSFPLFLQQHGGMEKLALAPVTISRTCEVARVFFLFMRREHAARYRGITETWLETIRPARRRGVQSVLQKHEPFALEDVRRVLALRPATLTERRDQAATAFLFLSGMRIGAFTSLPAGCVDLAARTVQQLPELGVRTKNSKAAVTFLLDLPDLLAVVTQWDAFVREQAGERGLWYLPLLPDGTGILNGGLTDSLNRDQTYRRGLRALCKAAGVPYQSPHKLRHGHAVYGIKNARNMAQLKAISQNLMHSSVTTTDGIYGNLKEEDIRAAIDSLTAPETVQPAGELQTLLKALSALQNRPDLIRELLRDNG